MKVLSEKKYIYLLSLVVLAIACIFSWLAFGGSKTISENVTSSTNISGVFDGDFLTFTYPANMRVMDNVEYHTFINQKETVGSYRDELFYYDRATDGQIYFIKPEAVPYIYAEGEGVRSSEYITGYAIFVNEFQRSSSSEETMYTLEEHMATTRNNDGGYSELIEVIPASKGATIVISRGCGFDGCGGVAAYYFDSLGFFRAYISMSTSDELSTDTSLEILKEFVSKVQIK